MNPATPTDLPFAQRLGSGKVRDLYAVDDQLLLVASDRVSAFDVVMAEAIPDKGKVLTEVSRFWFEHLADVVPNHLITTDVDAMEAVPEAYRDALRDRTTLCRRAEPLPVEWMVRGYLTGSGWRDYQQHGAVSGVTLPRGLQHASRIDPAILTPSTKAASGHDEPISFAAVVDLIGSDLAEQARSASLELFARAHDHASARGIVIADTKFEFGVCDGQLSLIDECLTPDSSRFWPAEEVAPGAQPTSFDKQLLRNYLISTGWNQEPPAPALSDEIVQATSTTYRAIRDRLIL